MRQLVGKSIKQVSESAKQVDRSIGSTAIQQANPASSAASR
ncbi:MAG: hypothetical protein QF757_01205 [Candidatus Marinimicrobia bacterium]|nr:hypothetical protein [Candidatus Neomarinimicrobiota bacterium]